MPLSLSGTTGIVTGNIAASNITTATIADDNVTTAKILNANVTPAKLSQPMTLGTAKAYNWNGLTTNTSLDFTDIPSWAKRITVMFNGVSTNGASYPMIQIGDSGGVEITGYAAGSSMLFSSTSSSNFTTGFTIRNDQLASVILDGFITINLFSSSSNTWVAGGVIYAPTPTAYLAVVSGSKSLSATLDRVRITTVGGLDTFDAGSVNILYEG